MTEKLIENETQAIEAIKSNMPTSGYYMLREALDMAIKALEEIQQYREIERELKEQYQADVDIKMLMRYFIETIFKGEKHERFCILTNEDADKWDAYKAIGTVEECREAKEKHTPIKPIKYEPYAGKCKCGAKVFADKDYCAICGQAIDWSDTHEAHT